MIGHVEGKVAIMSDDMIVTGGTLIAGADGAARGRRDRGLRLRDARALPRQRVREDRRQRAQQVTVTNTVPIDPINRPANIEVLPVSGLLAETIMNIFADDSVSAIFAGENQLF